MSKNISNKLIAVLDIRILKLYEAEGVKILNMIMQHTIHSDVDHKQLKHEGFRKQKYGQPSFYDPHSIPKDLEYLESAQKATNYIKNFVVKNKAYNQLFLVANPKMLGYLRNTMDNNLKSLLVKEVKKDLVKHSIIDIEKIVFRALLQIAK